MFLLTKSLKVFFFFFNHVIFICLLEMILKIQPNVV